MRISVIKCSNYQNLPVMKKGIADAERNIGIVIGECPIIINRFYHTLKAIEIYQKQGMKKGMADVSE